MQPTVVLTCGDCGGARGFRDTREDVLVREVRSFLAEHRACQVHMRLEVAAVPAQRRGDR